MHRSTHIEKLPRLSVAIPGDSNAFQVGRRGVGKGGEQERGWNSGMKEWKNRRMEEWGNEGRGVSCSVVCVFGLQANKEFAAAALDIAGGQIGIFQVSHVTIT